MVGDMVLVETGSKIPAVTRARAHTNTHAHTKAHNEETSPR